MYSGGVLPTPTFKKAWSTPLLATAAIVVGACGGGTTAAPDAFDGRFNRAALVEHLVTNLLLPIQDGFVAKANELPAAVQAFCTVLEAGTDATVERKAAQLAWANAVDAWQRADALLVGPAAMNNSALRSKIYAWPLMAPCGVDRDVVAIWNDPAGYSVEPRAINVRSLSAIEFLLFPPNDNHTCAVAPVGWDALAANLPKARCRLAAALSLDVAAQAATLSTAWRSTGGNYAGELIGAGTAASTLPSPHAALNLISDAMFYVDSMTKTMKLGESSGLSLNSCGTVETPCIAEVELRFADRASFALRANLRVLRETFTGKTALADGPGFDDFLIAVGRQDLADRITANIDAAIGKVDALPDSFLLALTDKYADVVAAYQAVKLITDDLKSQFLTVLALETPDSIATDND